MIVLDASVLIAHFKPTDAHHSAASEFFRTTLEVDLIVHPLTLAEVLVAAVRSGRGSEMLGDIESLGIQSSAVVDGESLRLATLRVTTGLKMPDCCVLDCAMAHEATLATFDEAMVEAAKQLQVGIAL